MALKPNKNKALDEILRKIEKRHSKDMKIHERYDFQDRIQFSVARLFIESLFKGDGLISRSPTPEAGAGSGDGDGDQHAGKTDLDAAVALVRSRFDEMVLYQKAKNNKKIETDMNKLVEKGIASYNLVESFLDEQKTDVELKLLAGMFGLAFTPVPEAGGGSPLGTVVHVDPRRPEEYMRKVHVLAKHLVDGAVLANYEYHWMPLREIDERPEFAGETTAKASIEDVERAPHRFKLNNPLSGTVLAVDEIIVLEKYTFYCFELDVAAQARFMQAMRQAWR